MDAGPDVAAPRCRRFGDGEGRRRGVEQHGIAVAGESCLAGPFEHDVDSMPRSQLPHAAREGLKVPHPREHLDAEDRTLLHQGRPRGSKLGLAQAARKELAQAPEPGRANLHRQNALRRVTEPEIRRPQQGAAASPGRGSAAAPRTTSPSPADPPVKPRTAHTRSSSALRSRGGPYAPISGRRGRELSFCSGGFNR